MNRPEDFRRLEAKARPVTEIVALLKIPALRVNGTELTGPCPLCGGKDRFNINLRTHAFLCRKCGIAGGDNIALVEQVAQMGFREALTWLQGDAPAEIDPAEASRRRARAEAVERRQAEATDRYRRQAIGDARAIWQRSVPAPGTLIAAYLATRGITADLLPVLPPALRFLPDHPYVKKIGRELVTLHRGPCMIAAIAPAAAVREGRPTATVDAVHQTWIDPAPPHGKAAIRHGEGSYPAKMVRGSKKGGAIRLATPSGADTLVMGEGIETTLSALVAQAVPGAAYWAGVDLGNMGGAGRPGERMSANPDLADEAAFLPPPWVRRLIYVMDGDSNPKTTRATLERGLRRAMALRPGLTGQIVHAGAGLDLNDVLTGKDGE